MSIYIGNDLEDRLEALEAENASLRKYNEYHQVVNEIDHMSDLHVNSSFYKQSMKLVNYVKINEWFDSLVNKDIKKLMNQRYKSLQKWQENRKNSELRLAYTKLRNKVNTALWLAEASYWREQFQNSTTTKEFWQIVRKLKRQTKDTNIAALDDGNGTMKSLDSEKAKLLNDDF